MQRRIRAALSIASLLMVATNVAAQQNTIPAERENTLQPGDLIRVQIWREEDLSGDFPVDNEGVVVLPLIGEARVTGRPLRELRDSLIADYRVHLRNPSIVITPLRRINVLGEVQKPGLYPVDLTISLAGVVAVAGGTTSTGDLTRIRIVRDGDVIRKRVGAGETLGSADIRSGDQIIVERRSWFDRNSTFLVSALLSVTSIAITIIQSVNRGSGG